MADQLSSKLAALRIQRGQDPVAPPRSRFGGAIIALLVVGAVGAAAAVAYPRLQAEVYKTQVSATEIREVSSSQASVTVTTSGHVTPQRSVRVGAKVPGRVAKVLVADGSEVQTGDLLFELESADQLSLISAAQARYAAGRARASAARATLQEVKLQAERERKLVERGVVGGAALEDLGARAESLAQVAAASEAEARAAAAEVEVLRVALGDRRVVAPMSGRVTNNPPSVGEMVGPLGQTAIEIVDFTSLVVETDVPELRLSQIKVGTPCELVLDAYPEVRHRGAVLEIGHRVNRAKATVSVRVAFVDRTEGILPDMAGRVGFLSKELTVAASKEPPRRVVPASAVIQRDGNSFVLAIEDGQVRTVPVSLGPKVEEGYQLLEGPPPGTRVVASPPPELKNGQKVKEVGQSQ